MENKNQNKNKVKLDLSAVLQNAATNLPCSEERDIKRDYKTWGTDNRYCDWLYSLFTSCPTVSTIITGTVDYVVGDGVESNFKSERDIEELVALSAADYMLYGGFALLVYRNKLGVVTGVDWCDLRHLRTNEKNSVFLYSEDWNKSYGRVKTLVYPAYMPKGKDRVSIVYVKNRLSRTAYPSPEWQAAVADAAIEKEISSFHLNEINNNFSASAIINFNNGVPSAEDKEEIEKLIEEKFTGSGNAGRFLLAFNKTKDNAVTIERLDADNFSDRYLALANSSRERIFTSFRAIPQLFGNMSAATGFSSQEFKEAFELYNRTKVKAIQKVIKNAFEKIDASYEVSFKPFTLSSKEQEEE